MATLREIAEGIADRLQGQCVLSLEEILEEEGFTGSDYDALVELVEESVFLCEECNWWCERSEERRDEPHSICTDCQPDDEDD